MGIIVNGMFKNKFETWIFNETQNFFIYTTTIMGPDYGYYQWRYYLSGSINTDKLELIQCKFLEEIPAYLLLHYKEPWSMISENEAKKLKNELIKSLFLIGKK